MLSEIARKAPRVTFSTTGASRTKQSFKAECDVNNVMRRFEKTGILEHTNRFEGSYGDFTQLPTDYQSAVDQVLAAQEMFSTVPAKVRARFANDPGEFLRFVEDPDNRDELVRLGLARAPRPDPVESSSDAARADTRASVSRAIPPDGGSARPEAGTKAE